MFWHPTLTGARSMSYAMVVVIVEAPKRIQGPKQPAPWWTAKSLDLADKLAT